MADQRPAPIFVADSVGLDFLNTLATPLDIEVEWLGSGEGLILWLLVLPHLRMLLSLDGCSSDCRPVRGC
ncbi:hypothetical protein AAFX91_42280, partial [Bradyrhizobium sp. 31Argb]